MDRDMVPSEETNENYNPRDLSEVDLTEFFKKFVYGFPNSLSKIGRSSLLYATLFSVAIGAYIRSPDGSKISSRFRDGLLEGINPTEMNSSSYNNSSETSVAVIGDSFSIVTRLPTRQNIDYGINSSFVSLLDDSPDYTVSTYVQFASTNFCPSKRSGLDRVIRKISPFDLAPPCTLERKPTCAYHQLEEALKPGLEYVLFWGGGVNIETSDSYINDWKDIADSVLENSDANLVIFTLTNSSGRLEDSFGEETDEAKKRKSKLNMVIKEYAQNYPRVFLVDTHKMFSSEGIIDSRYAAKGDGIHINPVGHRMITKELESILSRG